MDGRRTALIVANDEYEHEGLRHLRSPGADADALAGVLGDPGVGGFDVRVVRNQPAHVVGGDIEDLFSEARATDLLLVHFSCHGLKSESGELFFAARNTRPHRLGSTAVSADFVQRCMGASRSRSVVLLLDCCYGGAFGQGVQVRAAGDAHVLDSFPGGNLGGGRGRAVITASSSMEYAFEGDHLADDHSQRPSVFTSALVEGLATGDADRDEDGWVSLDELYDYVFDRVRERNPNQTPSRDVKMQGELYVARSRRRRITALPIPPDLQAAISDTNMFTRLGAVTELRARLGSDNLPAAAGAYDALAEIARSDIQYVADAASAALADTALEVTERELSFGPLTRDALPARRAVGLGGSPLARACTFEVSDPWIRADETPSGIDVSVDPAHAGRSRGTVTIRGRAGEIVVPVDVDVAETAEKLPAATAAAPPPPMAEPETDTEGTRPVPAVADAEATRPVPAGAGPEGVHPEVTGEADADLTRPGTAHAEADRTRPEDAEALREKARPQQRMALGARLTLVGAALLVLTVFLPYRYDDPLGEVYPVALWLLPLTALVLGGAALVTLRTYRTSVFGPGVVLGAIASATSGVMFVIGDSLVNDGIVNEVGFWVAITAHLLLLVAACFIWIALARSGVVRRIQGWPRGTQSWLLVVLGVVSALTLLAAGEGSTGIGPDLDLLWTIVVALMIPVAAVLSRPRRFGLGLVAGWVASAMLILLSDLVYGGSVGGIAFGLTLVALLVVAVRFARGSADQPSRSSSQASASG